MRILGYEVMGSGMRVQEMGVRGFEGVKISWCHGVGSEVVRVP